MVGAEESEVVRLGAEFGQDAIFVFTPASRSVVGCLSAREFLTGWSASAERPAEPTKTMALDRLARKLDQVTERLRSDAPDMRRAGA